MAPEQARHAVRVRRAVEGDGVGIFDDDGRTAAGELVRDGHGWAVRLVADAVLSRRSTGVTVYSTVPKGQRADWMVEKLSELGVEAFVPLSTALSVVEPGAGKLERFSRLARESTKQSERIGVMRIEPLMTLEQGLGHLQASGQKAALLSTERRGPSLARLDVSAVFIGAEGGWTDAELETMLAAGLVLGRLTDTLLRVETAAICAASILQVRGAAE